MAIKKISASAPDSEPDSDDGMPNFDQTQFDPEALMNQAVREAKGGGFEKLPPGNFVGVVQKIDTYRLDKGFFRRIHLVCNVEGNPSFRHIIWCHILLDDLRTFHEWGPTFFKRHMAALGYKIPATGNQKKDDEAMKAILAEIEETQPGVIISSTPNRKNPEWNDVAIKDRLGDDNEEVQAIREAIGNEPY